MIRRTRREHDERHLRHVCHYLGPIHIPGPVYEVWRAVVDGLSPRARRGRREQLILDALAGHQYATVTVIAMTLHTTPRRLWPDLERLMYACRITRVGGGSLTDRTQVRLATSAERGAIVPTQRTPVAKGGAR